MTEGEAPSLVDPYGKRGLMVHLAMSAGGIIAASPVLSIINARTYSSIIQSDVLPSVRDVHGDAFIFQQDNAPPHVARTTLELFAAESVRLLPWPPMSPDLNPVENIWAIISARLYKDGKSYGSEAELDDGLCRVIRGIEDTVCWNIVHSIPWRVAAVIFARGRCLTGPKAKRLVGIK